jgi:hypothetical protein
MKNKFFIEEQQNYNRSTEVIVFPLLFDYYNENEFLTHFYIRKYKMKLEIGREPHPSRVLFIGSSKRLKVYNAPMV